jgi:hypothetical protein
MKYYVDLFATRGDFLPGLLAVEAQLPLKYVLWGWYDAPVPTTYHSAADIPDLGREPCPIVAGGVRYLVLDREADLQFRRIDLNSGGTPQFEMSARDNQSAIDFQPGGLHDGRCIMAGCMAGCINQTTEHPRASELYKLFAPTITSGFRIGRGFSIGPEAESLFKSGYHLVTHRVDNELSHLDSRMNFRRPPSRSISL